MATVEHGVITGIDVLHPSEHIMRFDDLKEVAERAGWLMIHSDKLPGITLADLINYQQRVHYQAISK